MLLVGGHDPQSKGWYTMKKDEPLFDIPFLQRFSAKRIFLPLCVTFTAGVLFGSTVVSWIEVSGVSSELPLHISGASVLTSDFFSSFSTILLNALTSLLILFLLGVTAFGAVGVPLCLFLKGVVVGIGVLSFLINDSAMGLIRSALGYLPTASALGLLHLFLGSRAFEFSKSLAKAGFSSSNESLDFYRYLKDFLTLLCFAVAISLVGSLLALLSAVLF